MTHIGTSIRNLFVHKEGEPWPPKWMLIFCLLLALTGTGWNAVTAYRADQRSAQMAAEAAEERASKDQILDAAEQACDKKAPITKSGTTLCNEVQDQKGSEVTTPASIKFTDSITGYTFICYAEPKGSADYTCTQLLP
ncbi:hypothetical protein SEA_OTTAWA_49 [Arthrobacter phage Ottawa]|nr:hypothetical protein SEA_KHARCHO_49 [Arthrobacter phage Kharcho]WIC89281.1 hypothetical protein SEA_OTTAWA_49 [Arthrobacter phage Ottawa]